MSYSKIGYVPAERRFATDKTLTNSAFRIFIQLKGMARWKKHPEFKKFGRKMEAIQKGGGYFSQLDLAREMGWSTRTIRYALRELEAKGLITWMADEFNTRFRILVEARQFDAVWLDHQDPHLNTKPSYITNFRYKPRYKNQHQPQERVIKDLKLLRDLVAIDSNGLTFQVFG